ncbi:MAG TPA: hypothetical protein VI381_02555 [Allosphingosinicella sp.]
MLKAVLAFILFSIFADMILFDGYYRFMIVMEVKHLVENFLALGWTGLFIPKS